MSITLLSGDCRDVLPTLAANSVHCVVTSPPYYGLRDYGTAQWDGGDAECDHRQPVGQRQDVGREQVDGFHGSSVISELKTRHYNGSCGKCGARRVDRQIGLEASPDEYLATMVAVMREVRRVLRPDGTLWLNVGDSYSGNGTMGRNDAGRNFTGGGGNTLGSGNPGFQGNVSRGAKPKDLLLMPARLALALQADGWWVRSAIVWSKPNPMPESVTDRPTSAYEHVFLLTKSARYFWDAEAVREPQTEGTIERFGNGNAPRKPAVKQGGTDRQWREPVGVLPNGRNLRNVWTIATHAYPQAHFATYPPELAGRCIRAGTSERGCCAACGAPWRRTVDKAFIPQPDVSLARGVRLETQHDAANQWPGTPRGTTSATTTGWSASCACAAGVVPATVLDCFAGAGTTLLVADRLQRNAVGIELNAAYTTMAMDRVRADAPLFADTPEPQPVPGFAQPDLFAEAAD